MCTTIAERARIAGSAKGADGWFTFTEVQVAYDHPFHAPDEHAVGLDFVDEAGRRVAVELDRDAARQLAHRILATVALADAYEGT